MSNNLPLIFGKHISEQTLAVKWNMLQTALRIHDPQNVGVPKNAGLGSCRKQNNH